GEDTLDAVAQSLLDDSDVTDELVEPAGLERRSMVATPHRSVEGDMTLDNAGSERDCRDRDLEPRLVPRVSYGHVRVSLGERGNHPKVGLFGRKRISRGCVQQDQLVTP